MVTGIDTHEGRKKILQKPPLPEDLGSISLSDNARKVLSKRFIRRDRNELPVETIDEMFWRVAYHVASCEPEWSGNINDRARQFYALMISKSFFPNSPTFTGAGTPLGQLAACFVIPISDDMGRDSAGIFQSLRDAALIQQTGGGNGFSFSRLRPKGTLVKSSAGQATGPVGFLRVYDKAFGEIAQGGTRRGANMAVLRVDHPDIEDFITCKTDENAITNFNISVGITDAFMEAVINDQTWALRFPDVESDEYKHSDFTIEQAVELGIPIINYRLLRARELFLKIVRQAHHNGEPGVLFLDTANHDNPLPHLYRLEATNPCGEQFLGAYENCCLGSINLAQHVDGNGNVTWEKLRQSVTLSTIFLDNVVQVNAYVPAVPQLREAALRARRIGLGIMGMGDMMYRVGIRYGSKLGQEFAASIMEFVRFHAMIASIELAKERGAFLGIDGSIYDPNNLLWAPPQPIEPYLNEWSRPELDWQVVENGIKEHGIRNAAQTTIAPTGTIATVAGCEGYGCEPVFALAYVRHVDDNGKDLRLTYTSPLFDHAMIEAGLEDEIRNKIVEQVMERGTCQDIDDVPEKIQHVFVVSQDIKAEEHVLMQAAMQRFVDNSLSKTINFPSNASEDDVATAYMLAWKMGCKGITAYVTGSRQRVVLETNATAKKKDKSLVEQGEAQSTRSHTWSLEKKPRPRSLCGHTYSVGTPLGKAFVTINENGEEHPFEVFVNTAKAGSDTAAVSEAIGRLISYILRLSSPVLPRERLKEVWRQLSGIGGGRSSGFGPNRVRSLPDGVAIAIAEFLENTGILDHDSEEIGDEAGFIDVGGNGYNIINQFTNENQNNIKIHVAHSEHKIGDLCPECGQATLVNEEGCRKCYACDFSEC